MTYDHLLQELTAAGITIPAGVTTAKGTLDTFAARQPQPADTQALVDAYRAGQTDSQIAALASTIAAYPAMLEAHRVALTRYDRGIGAAVAAGKAAITASIDTALAALTPSQTGERSQLEHLRREVNAA